MKKTNPIYQVTAGDPGKLHKPIFWTVLTNVNLFSFLFLAIFILSIYNHFADPSAVFETKPLWMTWAAMVVIALVVYVLERKANHASYHDGYAASADGRERLAEHIRKLPLGFLMSKDSGELGNTMMDDFSQIEAGITHILPQLISGAIIAVLALVGMAFADWRMSLAMFCGLPVTILILLLVQSLDKKRGLEHTRARIQQTNRLQEYILGMKVIKAYNLRGANFAKLEEAFRRFRDESIKLEGVSGPFYLLSVSFLQLGLSMITMVGTYLLLGGSIDLPVFIMFLFVGSRVFDPLVSAITQLPVFTYEARAGARIVELLEEPVMEGIEDVPESHEIEFQNVTFGYGEKPVLKNVSARFAPGTMSAVVGPSGSGKSTMLRLIARFYDPNQGQVLFGGKPEVMVDPEKLMSRISVVFQDVYLFQDTILNNIRYGREDASKEDIIKAAKLARCHDFISALPDGYDTMVGEGGSTLSGGEKQRISIARAILKDAPVLLLDEATSSLDPENELEVQQALEELVANRTVIMIAHKLKTIAGCDQILVLDQGEIVERGTHEELLKKNGLYNHLWNLQNETEGWQIN